MASSNPTIAQMRSQLLQTGALSESKPAQAQKGITHVTKQEGPFFRVTPSSLGQGDVSTQGVREATGVSDQGIDTGTAGSTSRRVPKSFTNEEIASLIKNPENPALQIARQHTQEAQGQDFSTADISPSSLQKQSAIAAAHIAAAQGSPEYKQSIFDAYANQMPEVVSSVGAKNYDDLLEKAYRQLAKETGEQFNKMPVSMSFHRNGEGNYNGAKEMAGDVLGNRHLYVFQGGDKHDFLHHVDQDTGLNENEKFRAVHDFFGHAIHGNEFGPAGEEKAWNVHRQMYSPLAQLAMTAETRGQNSVVNYSPLNAELKSEVAKLRELQIEAKRRGDTQGYAMATKAIKDAFNGFQYAPQKAILLPPEFTKPEYEGGMPEYVQKLIKPKQGTEISSALTHFSHDPNLQFSDPSRYGTGIKGAEAERLNEYPGAVRDRSYFYMGEPGTVSPEPGLGINRYRGQSSNLYDITQDPLKFKMLAREANRVPYTAKYNQGMTYPLQEANDMERLVKEYGYQGMANPKASKPMAIMFDKTPLQRQANGGSIHMAGGGQPSMDTMKLALTKHGMYSPLEKATMGVNRTKGTPAEFMAEASKQPGFRKEEVADRKLQLPDQKLTKAEMLQHLQKSPLPKITEHVLEDFGDEEDALQTASQAIYGQDYDEVYDDRRAREKVEDWVKKHSSKYQDYQLPGGKNYREVLLQTPHFGESDAYRLMELEADKRRASYPEHWGKDTGLNKELADLMQRKESMGDQYHSSHWEGHPNVIAHMRMSDREAPGEMGYTLVNKKSGLKSAHFSTPEEAKAALEAYPESIRRSLEMKQSQGPKRKLLHIEEIQSDLHQEGRKKGYVYKDLPPLSPEEDKELMRLYDMGSDNRTAEESAHMRQLNDRLNGMQGKKVGVPDAPFKKNWHELAIKHALHHAAKHGYHGVVITPGEEQAKRYDLSKQIGSIAYNPEEKVLDAWDHNRRQVMRREITDESQLADYIGKEAASKLLKTEPMMGKHLLEGQDLQVGGEGMKGFYDKIVPDYLNKLGKPHGVKVGKMPLKIGTDLNFPPNDYNLPTQVSGESKQAHHFPITEPMRQQILQGQPMYKQGGIIHKAEGGNVQPSIAQMRMAINQRANPFDIQSIGVNEAPNMSPKLYMSPVKDDTGYPAPGGVATPNGMPIGGIDQSQQQPGQQLMSQPTMQPQGQGQQGAPGGLPGQPPQGGAPGPTGPTPPMGNMLSMTPQGQAMQAMGGAPQGGPPGAPTQPPPVGMARGGRASDTGYLVSTPLKPNPLVGQRFKAVPQGNLAQRQQFDIMKHEGKGSIVPIPYDATTRDNLVTEVSGHKLDKPLLTEAGFDYSLDPKHMAEEIGGASNAGIAGKVQKRIDQAAMEHEGDVFLMPNTMSDSQKVKDYPENFSHHPAHIVLDLLKQSQLNKKTMKTLSDDLRGQFEVVKTPNGYTKTYPYKNFLGYEHPNMMEQVMKGGHGLETTAGNLRKKMIERLGQVNIQKLLDYNMGDLRAAILDPDIATDPKAYMGHTVVRAKPGAPLRPSSHSSYDSDYAGTNVGGMGGNRPLEIMMPDIYSDIHKELMARPAKTVKTDAQMRAQVVGALEKRKQKFAQPINARVINNAGLYEEGLKNGEFDPKNIESILAYYKRKGGYKKGGEVKLAPTQDTMRLALTKKKAK